MNGYMYESRIRSEGARWVVLITFLLVLQLATAGFRDSESGELSPELQESTRGERTNNNDDIPSVEEEVDLLVEWRSWAVRYMYVAERKQVVVLSCISPEAEDESTNSSSSNQIDCYTYDSFLLRVLANYSIMHLFVYALATGNKFPRITGAEDDDEMPNIDDIDISGTNVSTYFLSQLSSCAFATDLILRAGNHEEVGEALKFLSFQIQHSKESQMKDILSKLRLTYSRSHEVKWRSREYRERVIDPATAIGTRDLILASADNVQWRYGNKYDHWVAILLHALIETEMLRRGILNDDDPSKRLSRERVDYREYVQSTPRNDVLDEVFRPRENDYGILGEAMLTHLELTIRLLPDLPSVRQCNSIIRKKKYTVQKPLPVLYRTSRLDDLDQYLKSRPGIDAAICEDGDDADEDEKEAGDDGERTVYSKDTCNQAEMSSS